MSPQRRFLSRISQRLSFRAGHVVINPHVHDFVVRLTASAPVDETGMGADVLLLRRVMAEEVAHVLGHRMSVWVDEPEEVRSRPVDWPKDLAGPAMPDLPWEARPTVENLTRWTAQRLVLTLAECDPKAELLEVEVAETRRTSAVVEKDELTHLLHTDHRVPGPILGPNQQNVSAA